jgi:hypothetical protein
MCNLKVSEIQQEIINEHRLQPNPPKMQDSLSVCPVETVPKLFALGSVKNNVVGDNEFETQFNRESASLFYVDHAFTSLYHEPALGTDSYQEFLTLMKGRKYFQSILLSENEEAYPIPKLDRFLLEVQKAFSEIYLLTELTTSVKNCSRFMLINSFVKEGAESLLVSPLCQKIYHIVSLFSRSVTFLACGQLDFQRYVCCKRILVYYLAHHLSYQALSIFSALSVGKFQIDLLFASRDTGSSSFGRRYESFRDYPAFDCSFSLTDTLSPLERLDSSLVSLRYGHKSLIRSLDSCSSTVRSKTIRIALLVQRPAKDTDGPRYLYEIASESFWKFLKGKSNLSAVDVDPPLLSSFGNMKEFCIRKQHESLCLQFFDSLKNECVDNSHLICANDLDVAVAESDFGDFALELFLQESFRLTAIHIRSEGIFLRLSESFFLQIRLASCENAEEYCSQPTSRSTFFSSLIQILVVQSMRSLLLQFPSTVVTKLNVGSKRSAVRNFQDFDTLKLYKRSSTPVGSLRTLVVILRCQSLKLRMRKFLQFFFHFLHRFTYFRDKFEWKFSDPITTFVSFCFELRTPLFPFHLLLRYDDSCFTRLEVISNHPLLLSENSLNEIDMIDNEGQLECALNKIIFGEVARCCCYFHFALIYF